MQHSFSSTHEDRSRMVRWHAHERPVVRRSPRRMASHMFPVLLFPLLLLLVAVPSSASAAEDRGPLVPLTSRFAHWDHHWFVWLPRHRVYEAVEVASMDTPEHPVRLV